MLTRKKVLAAKLNIDYALDWVDKTEYVTARPIFNNRLNFNGLKITFHFSCGPINVTQILKLPLKTLIESNKLALRCQLVSEYKNFLNRLDEWGE